MRTVTLEVASREEVTRRALEAFRGRKQGARISFATPELLWKVEVARRLGRDVKAVHGDVHALIDAGLVDRTEKNQVVFPFDAVRVEFTLRVA